MILYMNTEKYSKNIFDIQDDNFKGKYNEYKTKYSDHDTTFIPLFPLGLKSFKLKSILGFTLFLKDIDITFLFKAILKR